MRQQPLEPQRPATNTPKVSVVMGIFNGGDHLEATIDSILAQSFEDFEFIIVDDGSTDQSPKILAKYALIDPRIVVITQPNAGLTRALISGCERAKGQLIARQDVGDRALPDRFKKQIAFLDQHPDVVAVGSGARRMGPGGEYLGETMRGLSPQQVTDALLQQGVGISHMVAMFRKQAYDDAGGYRRQFRYAQDTDLWHRMARIGLLAEVPEVLFEWGIDVDGISATSTDRQHELARLARESHQSILRGDNDDEILEQADAVSWKQLPKANISSPKRILSSAEFFIGSQLYSRSDRRCRSYFWRAIQSRPLWPKPWVKLLLSFLTTSNVPSESKVS